VASPSSHARAIAFLGTVWGVAALAGPALGGLFAELNAWRWAFGIDVVVGAIFIAAAEGTLRRDGRPVAPARPFPGMRLILLVLAALCVGWGGAAARAPQALLGLLGAVACLLIMLRIDGAGTSILLPSGAYWPTRPLGAVSATMGLLFLASGPSTFITYLLNAGHGIAPIGGYASATLCTRVVVRFVTHRLGRASRRADMPPPRAFTRGTSVGVWAVETSRLHSFPAPLS
jgi:hypothetical protein